MLGGEFGRVLGLGRAGLVIVGFLFGRACSLEGGVSGLLVESLVVLLTDVDPAPIV
jgi:hypothetical protein